MEDPTNDVDKKTTLDTSGVALLSCELCSRRKIRCDKRSPCSACQKSGRECVPVMRPRLPRGRRGGRKEANQELRTRVRRLEDLVQSLSGSASSPPSHNASTIGLSGSSHIATKQEIEASSPYSQIENRNSSTATTSSTDISRSLGSTVWTQLSSELTGLRSVLEAHDEDDGLNESPQDSASPPIVDPVLTDSPLTFGTHEEAAPIDKLTAQAVSEILDLFKYRIDSVLRVVHVPTFRSSVKTGCHYLGYPARGSAFQALKSAVFYATFCSMNDAQCLSMFAERKETLQERWRMATEYWLRKEDVTNNHNIVNLQALLFYVAAVRTHNNGPRAWTLVGLAARIAVALQLHREESYASLSFFQAQVHRRAWACILGLDYQGSHDRGSDLTVPANSYNTKCPLNINDEDISISSDTTLIDRLTFTDMTFMRVATESAYLIRQLNFVPAGDAIRPPTEMQYSFKARQKAVTDLSDWLNQNFLQMCDLTVPIQYATFYLGKVMLSCMHLFVVRPLQRHPAMSAPPHGCANVLLRATETLEYWEVFTKEVCEPWTWLFHAYVDWHPLAILLAELCSPQTDALLVQRAWRQADYAFENVASKIAEGTQGTLWKPLRNLMRMAQQRRALDQALLPPVSGQEWMSPTAATTMPMSQPASTMPMGSMSGLDTMSSGLDPSLPTDFGFGSLPLDDSWMNWQGFVDDMTQNSYTGWTPSMPPFPPNDGAGGWQ